MLTRAEDWHSRIGMNGWPPKLKHHHGEGQAGDRGSCVHLLHGRILTLASAAPSGFSELGWLGGLDQ
jgi:hypothetical protein